MNDTNIPIVHRVAKRIDTLRTQQELSIRELAKRSGIAQSALYNILQGNKIPKATRKAARRGTRPVPPPKSPKAKMRSALTKRADPVFPYETRDCPATACQDKRQAAR